jgi:DNA polymerase-1
MFQCATDDVHVLHAAAARRAPTRWAREVRERYGIAPEQVPDFIALRGDPSTGCRAPRASAPRRAADLLQRKGDLEHAILGAIREKPSVRAR